jgi:hypothetical protein
LERARFDSTETDAVEIRARHAADESLGLVDRQKHRLARAAQLVGKKLILGGEAIARIRHEDEAVSFLDGVFGLDAHERVHAAGVFDQAAGVDADVLDRA